MILNFRAVHASGIYHYTTQPVESQTTPSNHCSRHPTLTQSCWSLHTNPEVFTLSWFFCYIFFLFFRQRNHIFCFRCCLSWSIFPIKWYYSFVFSSPYYSFVSFRLFCNLSSRFSGHSFCFSTPIPHSVHSKHWESFIKHRRLLLSSFMIDGNRFKTWFWSSGDMPVARNPNFKFSEDNRIDWLIEQTTITREVQVAFRNVTTCLRLFSPAN